jgi:hypothetical protein
MKSLARDKVLLALNIQIVAKPSRALWKLGCLHPHQANDFELRGNLSRRAAVWAEGKAEMTMRGYLILVAICSSNECDGTGYATKGRRQTARSGKPKAPQGCKLVGTVKGIKLWAGDCRASEPDNAAAEMPPPLAARASGAIPPGPK